MLIAAVAAVELLLLVIVGGALLAKPDSPAPRAAAKAKAATASTAKKAAPIRATKAPPAELPRRKVRVVVLNGNGRQGAAAQAAARVTGRGYKLGVVGNAPRQDYPRSLVMYRRGFEGEARRLARDLGVTIVGPLDGMRSGQLHGAHAVFILGS